MPETYRASIWFNRRDPCHIPPSLSATWRTLPSCQRHHVEIEERKRRGMQTAATNLQGTSQRGFHKSDLSALISFRAWAEPFMKKKTTNPVIQILNFNHLANTYLLWEVSLSPAHNATLTRVRFSYGTIGPSDKSRDQIVRLPIARDRSIWRELNLSMQQL